MNEQRNSSIPLVGALLVAENKITNDQLATALRLQTESFPGQPLSEILVRYGFIGPEDLAGALLARRELSKSLLHAIDEQVPPVPDMHALLVSERSCTAVQHLLHRLAVAVRRVSGPVTTNTRATLDLILLDPALADTVAIHRLPPASMIALLPPDIADVNRIDHLPTWATMLLERSVEQSRDYRRQRMLGDLLRRDEYEFSALATMMQKIGAATDPQTALSRLMGMVRDLIPVEAGTLFHYDQATRELVFDLVFGPHEGELQQQRLPVEYGIAGWVARYGEPLIINDVQQDLRFDPLVDQQTGFQTRSVLCVPISVFGRTLGVLQVINRLGGDFDRHDLSLLRITATLGAFVLALYEKEHHAADAAEVLKQIAVAG
jgi:GAF domain-containing protein